MPQTDCKPLNKPAITPPNRLVFDYFMAKTEKANRELTKIDKNNGNNTSKNTKETHKRLENT